MIKKSLGQNFFINENLGNKIVEYVESSNPDIIVEIGPGRGFFTKKLSQICPKLLLVEKDDELAKQLSESYPLVINIDFLGWDFKELKEYDGKKIVFFGSLPYNVSKPIIQRVIASNFFNTPAYFIVQKEVAEKYTVLHPENNILSLRTQLLQNQIDSSISAPVVLSKPKVDSSFISFAPTSKHTI
jgi:16S rRNA (adenine1518-N6/adenine1519-N6)-dimethyltransferase